MISKLPSWVWIGGGVLASIAGFVNAVGLLGFEHQAVSHMTGLTSQFGIALVEQQSHAALHLLAIISAFFCGAILSGFVVRESTLKLGRHYGTALALESLFLVISVPFLNSGSLFGVLCVALCCGLQNAMASTYSGAIIRTTHVTGLFTDAGIVIGQGLAGLRPDYRRLLLAGTLITGYLVGGIFGGYLYFIFKYDTLYLAAVLTGFMAVGYAVSHKFRLGLFRSDPTG